MPQRMVCTYHVNVSQFIDSVKLSSVFGKQEESLKVLITKNMGSDIMRLSSKVSEVGEYETELAVEVISEEENIEINFSPRKIIDVLGKIYTENVIVEVVIHPRTEHKMLIFKEESNDRFMHLLTPMIGA
jgi:DNA polymerase III sliding clamp (beta) subunit (PCNA family)